jgi:uncharacterized protein
MNRKSFRGETNEAPGIGSSPHTRTDCGDFPIHIARDGTWWHEGSPIRRHSMVKLFASVLRRAEDGSYQLVTPVERGRITVEDAPFIAVELTVVGEGRDQVLTFRTNVDDSVSAGEEHPIRILTDGMTQAPNPYILVKSGLEARMTRAVFYHLVESGREEQVGQTIQFGVWSQGKFFPLGDPGETL